GAVRQCHPGGCPRHRHWHQPRGLQVQPPPHRRHPRHRAHQADPRPHPQHPPGDARLLLGAPGVAQGDQRIRRRHPRNLRGAGGGDRRGHQARGAQGQHRHRPAPRQHRRHPPLPGPEHQRVRPPQIPRRGHQGHEGDLPRPLRGLRHRRPGEQDQAPEPGSHVQALREGRAGSAGQLILGLTSGAGRVTQERVEKSDVTMREPGADDTCGEAAKSVRRLASDVRLTTAEIDNLRASLPDMDFDPARDSDPAQALIAEKYLRLYGMDYADKYLHRWGRVMLPRYTIACHYWFPDKTLVPPDKGVVVVLHGYFDHVGLFGHLIRHLLERGYGVVAFDLPGHGLSSGERASIATFAHYVEVFEAVLREISKAFPVPVAAVGQSTGGAILLNYLARGGAGLDR